MTDNNTNVPEVKEEQTNEEPVQEEQVDAVDEPTVGDLGVEEEEPQPEKKNVDSVPISRLNKEIQRRKELERQLEELTAEKDEDPEVEDTSSDPEVRKLAEKLEKIEQNERRAKANVIFETNLNKALDNAPEFREVANVDVIRQMAFNPANKDKTYRQLLEEAYGNALSGKRSTETTTPRGGAKDTKVDMQRAQNDTAYRREVLADPNLRKQYNEGIEHRINL